MDRETRLGLIASAILEGSTVDWPSVTSASEPGDEPVIRQLRLLADIAAVHRESSSPAAPTHDPAFAGPATALTWGHLHLLEIVGRGAFGDVYRAWDPHLHREVALKLLRTGTVTQSGATSVGDPDRVVHEGRLLARVRHPHVVTVYGAEPRDGNIGLWMEFIRGRTLHQVVEQHGPLAAGEAAAIGADLCRALGAVHTAGLLHRDLSARNVMREDGGRVVLMDFGAGLEEGRQPEAHRPEAITGTPLYMAPELFSGAPASIGTDVYAAGIVLFYLVTGQYPVAGRTIADIRAGHRAGVRTRLVDLRPDLPAPFVRVVERATAVASQERHRSAGGLAAALAQALVDDTAQTASAPRPALTVAALAVGALMAGGAWWTIGDQRAEQRLAPSAPGAASQLTARRLTPPPGVWLFSNPSTDGRLAAGQITDSGDVAIVDLSAGTYRELGIAAAAGGGGYASAGTLSSDGRFVAVEWYDARGAALWIADTSGGPARRLLETSADISTYQWSSDGAFILTALGRDGAYDAALVAVTDGSVRRLAGLGATAPTHMTLSPDARFVVYDAPDRHGSADHDLFVLDANTGATWPLVAAPSYDASPFWTPDGRAVVFISDRSRTQSLWSVAVDGGHAAGEPQLLRDDVGRVALRGFTGDGTLHYQLFAGFAEVYIVPIAASPATTAPISPRNAVSNFYPAWSPDGRSVAYTSERGAVGRELWVHDLESGRDVRVATGRLLGRPFGWSPDGRWILASGPNDGRLYRVERLTGRTDLAATGIQGRAAWTGAGIVVPTSAGVAIYPPGRSRPARIFAPEADADAGFGPSLDGRAVMAASRRGWVRSYDTDTGQVREWRDAGLRLVAEHGPAPHSAGVAYAAWRRDLQGEVRTLMYWGGSGEPRELLRTVEPESFRLAGWTDDQHLLVVRLRLSADGAGNPRRGERLWRVPVGGAPPTQTAVAMEGLRDIVIDPNGRQIAFNAGWKQVEHWVMENLLR